MSTFAYISIESVTNKKPTNMSDSNKPGVQTSVQTTEADLSVFDVVVGADNIMTPDNEKKGPKANIFSNPGIGNTQFLDNDDHDDEEEEEDDKGAGAGAGKGAGAGAGDDDDEEEEEDDDDDKGGAGVPNLTDLNQDDDDDDDAGKGSGKGRPKTDKSGLVDLAKKLIEAKQIVPFDDDKPIEDYTLQDFEELFQANFEDQRTQLQEKITKDFWESMPEEVQYIGQYLANGGQNLKQLFTALAQVEQTRELDPDSETDQELITREYLRVTNFGNEEEISEEIQLWKDLSKLGQKAKQFKPKLDKMNEDRVAHQLAQQEAAKKKQQDAARNYMKSVYDTLEPGELNGIKLNKKTQSMLYSGLVQANYPSVTGRQTNLLGHLMEKYQFVEPDHGLIAEVLWLLSDPKGYRDELRKTAASDANKKTVKLLKGEEQRKITSSNNGDDDEAGDNKKGRKLVRPVNVFTGKKS